MIARALRPLARVTAPLSRPLAGRRFITIWALVEYSGRKTGRRYRLPLATRRTRTSFLFPVAFGPGSQWPLNVLATGGCAVRWNGRWFTATDPRIIGADEAIPQFAALERPILRAIRTERFLAVRTNDERSS
jgi:hypothetical protein